MKKIVNYVQIILYLNDKFIDLSKNPNAICINLNNWLLLIGLVNKTCNSAVIL